MKGKSMILQGYLGIITLIYLHPRATSRLHEKGRVALAPERPRFTYLVVTTLALNLGTHSSFTE